MITEFGEFCRVHRIMNHQVMGDQAKYLEVSTPYLSACENGRQKIPLEWVDKLVQYWHLDNKENMELFDKIHVTNQKFEEHEKTREWLKEQFGKFNEDESFANEVTFTMANMLVNKKKYTKE